MKFIKKKIKNKELPLFTRGAVFLQNGGVIIDPQGQYNHPGKNTLVPTQDGRITMKGVNYPLLGIDETGDTKVMFPNREYKFRGKNIYEIPLFQQGGTNPPITLTDRAEFNRRNKAYNDSLNIYNQGEKSYNYTKRNAKSGPNKNDIKVNLKSEKELPYKKFIKEYNQNRPQFGAYNSGTDQIMYPEKVNHFRGDGVLGFFDYVDQARFKKPTQPYLFKDEKPFQLTKTIQQISPKPVVHQRKPLGYQSQIPYSNKINPVDIGIENPNLNPTEIPMPKVKPIGVWNAIWADETGRQQQIPFENEQEYNQFLQKQKNYDIQRTGQYGQPGQKDYRKEVLLRRPPIMQQGGGFDPQLFNDNAEYNYYKKMLYERLRNKNPEQFTLMEQELSQNAQDPFKNNSQDRQKITEKYNIALGEDELKETLGGSFDRFNQLRTGHKYNYDYGMMEKSPEAMRQFSVNDIAIMSKPSSYQDGNLIYNPTFDENGLSLDTNMSGFQSFKAPSKINTSMAIKKKGGMILPKMQLAGMQPLSSIGYQITPPEAETTSEIKRPTFNGAISFDQLKRKSDENYNLDQEFQARTQDYINRGYSFNNKAEAIAPKRDNFPYMSFGRAAMSALGTRMENQRKFNSVQEKLFDPFQVLPNVTTNNEFLNKGNKMFQEGGEFEEDDFSFLFNDEPEMIDEEEYQLDSFEIEQPQEEEEETSSEDIITFDEEEDYSPVIPQTQTRSQGVNNPGNIRGTDGTFRNFSTYEEGKEALKRQLRLYQSGQTKNKVNPNSTLLEAISVYAPANDNNNPQKYAEFVAKKLGVDINTPISQLNIDAWADAMEIMEGNTKRGNAFEKSKSLEGMKYGFGASGNNNSIDCSGAVCKILNLPRNTSEGILQNSKNLRMLKNTSDIKEGSVIGFDTGAKKWDAGRKMGIDHVGVVVRNPQTGQLEYKESVSGKGFRTLSLQDMLNTYQKGNNKIYIGEY